MAPTRPDNIATYAPAMTTVATNPARATDLDWSLVSGLAGFRWLALGWAATVLVLTRADVGHPLTGIIVLLVALAVTTATTEASIRRRPQLFHPAAMAGELAVGMSMLLLDGHVYDRAHSQSLGSAWPLAGVLMVAIAAGPVGGSIAGALLGVARWLGDWWSTNNSAHALALTSTGVLYAIAGGAAGAAVARMRSADAAIARARAREEVARTLHDGVLQTLAVVQRRSSNTELVALARDQELELRAFLAGDRTHADVPDQLGAALRAEAARVERRDGLRVEVLVLDEDHPPVAAAVVGAIAGAVGEALTNASKHGQATKATVFVDVDDWVFCSVKDDGQGFDPGTVTAGMGTTASITGRLAEVGGTAEIDARPGTGVEVRLNAPRS